MGFLGRISSVLLGSSEEKLIKAKKEIVYNSEKALHPKEAKALEQIVSSQYEKALEQILYTIGNSLRHHAHLTNADHVKNSAFMERFVENYGFEYFINGVSLGHQIQAGTTDVKFQREISTIMEGLHNKMMKDAMHSFSSQKVAECFSAGAKVAADLGAEAGAQIYNQGFIVIEK
jgi:hypothetical protein